MAFAVALPMAPENACTMGGNVLVILQKEDEGTAPGGDRNKIGLSST